LKRYIKNPIIVKEQIPEILPDLWDVSSVFNPGAIRVNDEIILILRVQNRARETYFLTAKSIDGINFQIIPKIIKWEGIEKITEKIYHIYDPRIVFLDEKYYIIFAMDTDSGCKLGIGFTTDFDKYFFIGLSGDDVRNGVIFPEKFHNFYYRFERPNKTQLECGVTSGNSIWLAKSIDLLKWEMVSEVMSGNSHYWDERIGSGPTPIKTREGWLHIYHGIADHFTPIYQAGVSLHDLNNPEKVLSRCRFNILEPREIWETTGQVPNVCFPSGAVVFEYDEEGFALNDSKVFIYYGAADTSIGLAETTISELIRYSYMS